MEIQGEERLVVACEVERTHLRKLNTSEVVSAVRHSIWMKHELKVYGVLLLKTGSIPKTSSGKIQRHACRKDWLDKQLNLVGESVLKDLVEPINTEQPIDESLPIDSNSNGNKPFIFQDTASKSPANEYVNIFTKYQDYQHLEDADLYGKDEIANWIEKWLAKQSGIEVGAITRQASFADYGIDSVLAVELVQALEEWLKISLDTTILWNFSTIESLAEYLASKNQTKEIDIPLLPVPRNQNLPLSFEQERLWAINQFIPNGAVHNITQAFRIKGQLNIEVLQRSVNEIIHRHEALRTSFFTVDGFPIQVITPNINITLEVVNSHELNPSQRTAVIQEIVDKEAEKSFNLEGETLFDFKLVQLNKLDFVLILRIHHLISDGISVNLLIQEIATLYEAFSQGKQSPLPELDIHYGDFAVWQRQCLKGEVLEQG
ncbi:MAG: condensation domain-containing protein [Rivularia sp. ALOHA_DT_140]|nr:condensation domain-containing protein [Rivularia sp. ALOHA_DT_140]